MQSSVIRGICQYTYIKIVYVNKDYLQCPLEERLALLERKGKEEGMVGKEGKKDDCHLSQIQGYSTVIKYPSSPYSS